jgi:hypothetical protein
MKMTEHLRVQAHRSRARKEKHTYTAQELFDNLAITLNGSKTVGIPAAPDQ